MGDRTNTYTPLYHYLEALPAGAAVRLALADLTALIGPPTQDGWPRWAMVNIARMLREHGTYRVAYDRSQHALTITRTAAGTPPAPPRCADCGAVLAFGRHRYCVHCATARQRQQIRAAHAQARAWRQQRHEAQRQERDHA